jgi:outer membrane lipoprotein SlyB
MKNRVITSLKYTVCVVSIVSLASCAATGTMIEHRTLDTQTKLSKTIFLDPVDSREKTIFIVVKNTSNENIDINRPLEDALRAHGYRVVKSPVDAHYLLQANILSIGKMSIAASQTALGGGYGSALAGGVVGASLGHLSGESGAMLAGGLAGGLVGLAADSLVKDVNYSMITDVQISERVGRGVTINEQYNASLGNGSSSTTHQTSSRKSQYQRYRTRVVSNADKVNLSFAVARPALEQGLVKTLAGIF